MSANSSQLIMVRQDLTHLPDIPTPLGYRLRNYEPGDEDGLLALYETAGFAGFTTIDDVRNKVLDDPNVSPGRLFVLDFEHRIVGTAIGRQDIMAPDTNGWLHLLAVSPEHYGKRLGAVLTLATLRRNREEGFVSQGLFTDDARTAAITLYLRLGYVPVIPDSGHLKRWRAVAGRLQDECREALGRILHGAEGEG